MGTLLSITLIFGIGSAEILFIILVLFVPYFIPSIIARNKMNFTGILLLNIFLGWTFLGWVGALIWAITDKTPAEYQRLNNSVKQPDSAYKHKCRHCGFESYEKTTFCPVCSKDEKGMTMEDYKNNYSKSS